MFKVQELREIIKLIDSTTIDEFVYEADGAKIKVKKNNGVVSEVVAPKVVEQPVQAVAQQPAAPAPAKQEAPKVEEVKAEKSQANVDDSSLYKITSPMVGTFYASPSPDAPPFVKPGDKVEPDTTVCIVEAMKLFNEIEAEVKGEIVEVLVENEQLVEFGQPLFLVKVAE